MIELNYIIYTTISLIVLYTVVIYVYFLNIKKQSNIKEQELIENFYYKVNKIPSMVEIMKKYTNHPDIFEDIIHLHKLSMVSKIDSIYDMLELNLRIHREFEFLMKLSNKIKNLHKDGNFLYIRNHVIFFEKTITEEISWVNRIFSKLNKIISLKNLFFIGFLLPSSKKILI